MRRPSPLSALLTCIALCASTGGCNVDLDPQDPQTAGSGASGASSGSGGAGGGGAGGGGAGGSGASRCTASAAEVSCSYEEATIPGQAGLPRNVVWQVPLGTPPAEGWPVVILFQGSFVGPLKMFGGQPADAFGRYWLALTVKGLLDAGYAVLAPAAHVDGATYWDTNIPPWSTSWTSAPDHALMLSLFDAIAAGQFGPLDSARMYATGISSGGYMTSRMAVSYPGRFKALAIHSASYATCSAICIVPETLPSDHPPTLFLHGEADLAVPISTMKAYDARLVAAGKETRVVVDPEAGHEWLAAGAPEVLAWFDAHP